MAGFFSTQYYPTTLIINLDRIHHFLIGFSLFDAAAAAIEKFNGVELNGRVINVNEARPRPERNFGGSGGGFAGGRGQRREPRW